MWQTDPFLTQRCTVSVPSNVADTCSDHETAQVQGSSELTAWVISFSESLTTLPGSQQATLLQVAQTALAARQSTDIVRPQEHYVLAPDNPACRSHSQAHQCYATATQSMRATLSFQLDTNAASNKTCIDPQPGGCTLFNQDCHLLCGGSFQVPSSTREWDVFAPVLSLWTFVTMDGRVLARNIPDDSAQDYASGQALDKSLVQLRITWDKLAWHVALSANMDSQDSGYQGSGYFNPVCAAMMQQVKPLKPPVDANGEPVYLQWQFASGTLPAAGCLAVGKPQPGNGLTTPTPAHAPQPVFYYLNRFGVLLAVNKLAQRSELLLPLADAHEQQLARGMGLI